MHASSRCSGTCAVPTAVNPPAAVIPSATGSEPHRYQGKETSTVAAYARRFHHGVGTRQDPVQLSNHQVHLQLPRYEPPFVMDVKCDKEIQ